MSKEYLGAIAIVVISILRLFNIEISIETVQGFITSLSELIVTGLGIWIAILRYKRGDITKLGVKKHKLA
jgi:hypothetical protein